MPLSEYPLKKTNFFSLTPLQPKGGFVILSTVNDKHGQQRLKQMENIDRKHMHIAEVMQNEINPEEYLRREREISRGNIIETVSVLLLIPLAYLIVKLWFAVEGFSIQW